MLASSSAHAARTRCTTKTPLKVSLKNRDKSTTWVILKAGTDIEVRNRAADWTEIGTADGFARAATVYLKDACALPPIAKLRAQKKAATAVAAATPNESPDWAKLPAGAKPDGTKPDGTKPDGTKPDATTPDATQPDATPTTVVEAPVIAPAEPEPEWVVPKGVTVSTADRPAPIVEDTVTAAPTTPWESSDGLYEDLELDDVTTGVGRRLVAVNDLRANESAGKIAAALTTVLNADIGAREGLRTISRNEVKSVVEHQATSQLLGCESVGCAADLAKLLDAELIVAGSVEVIENAHVMSVSLIDPTVPRILGREELSWHGDPDDMIEVVRPIVDRLLAGAKASSLIGTVEVFAPEGATVIVDGKEVSKTPLAPVAVTVGTHKVLVQKDGFEPATYAVAVAANDNTLLRTQLIEQPWYTQWWFWTATGGGLLVAASTAVGVTAYGIVEAQRAAPPRGVLGEKP